jgi:predicted ArsR family transcriptional regulator
MNVNGLTITELSKELGIKPNAVRQRLFVAGIRPIVVEKIYPPETLEIIRDVRGKGRPPKDKPDKPAE